MSCNQDLKKTDLNLVTKLALKFAAIIEADVRIYRKNCPAIGIYYDFEPAEVDRGNTDVVEIIKVSVLLSTTEMLTAPGGLSAF